MLLILDSINEMARRVKCSIGTLVVLAVLLLCLWTIENTPGTVVLKVTNQESTKAWCIDGLCLEYLSDAERGNFTECTLKAAGMKLDDNALCHFMNGTGRQPVALVSFPGSGNTWVRGLLQKATGICTGSMYCDLKLKPSFLGEGVRGASVLAVQTHNCANLGTEYGSAIFIVRDIRDALVSMQSTMISGNVRHFGLGNKDWGRVPQTTHSVFHWRRMMITWAEYSKTHPMLVVHYKDLKTDIIREVQKILDFLGIPSRDPVQNVGGDNVKFRRKRDQELEPYTPDQKKFLNKLVAGTKRTIAEKGLQDIFHLDRYVYLE